MQTRDALGASGAAIRHHYDAGNDFYRLWLDESLTYSGALYGGEHDEPLESAQERKLDYHAEQAHVAGARRVLDVGCGWGSLLRRLVDAHGVQEAVGITLSEAQAKWIAARPDERIRVHVQDWSEHRPDAPYDAIISLGAMEHFARPDIPIAEKTEAYRHFFRCCHAWLRPGGWLSIQAIAYGNLLREDFAKSFIARDIFPESDFVGLAELADASAYRFEIVRLRNDRKDYERTCAAWLAKLRHNRDQAVAVAGAELVERYERYLDLCVRGWQLGATHLLRIAMRRVDAPRL